MPVGVAVLELLHPAWPDGFVGEVVQPIAGWWIVLHLCLLTGYLGLVVLLWRATHAVAARCVLVVFAVCNTVYLALDGIGVGLLARSDPSAADVLWARNSVAILANVTGGAWAAALLLIAVSVPPAVDRVVCVGSALTWLAFVASAIAVPTFVALPDLTAGLLSRLLAVGTGAWAVYQRGSRSLPTALLIFASVLRQHVGAEAAMGLICVAIALALLPTRAGATARSGPEAASRP